MLRKTAVITCSKFKLRYTKGINSSKYSLLITYSGIKTGSLLGHFGRNLSDYKGEERRKKEKRKEDEQEI